VDVGGPSRNVLFGPVDAAVGGSKGAVVDGGPGRPRSLIVGLAMLVYMSPEEKRSSVTFGGVRFMRAFDQRHHRIIQLHQAFKPRKRDSGQGSP